MNINKSFYNRLRISDNICEYFLKWQILFIWGVLFFVFIRLDVFFFIYNECILGQNYENVSYWRFFSKRWSWIHLLISGSMELKCTSIITMSQRMTVKSIKGLYERILFAGITISRKRLPCLSKFGFGLVPKYRQS